MIDLHSHLLPGVDDGASDLREAVAMCRMAADDGCTAIVATPHLRHERWWNGDPRELSELWNRLRQEARPYLEVFLGGEIAVNSQSCGELEQLPAGDLLSLNSSRYLLLEFHPRGLGPDPEELIHELVVLGWIPVIAHPERIPWLAENPGFLAALIELGALSQVTAMSVTGDFGRHITQTTNRLLEDSLVHFVASDAHDLRLRPPGLKKAFRQISEEHGEQVARQLFVDNPHAVLHNRPLLASVRSAPVPADGALAGTVSQVGSRQAQAPQAGPQKVPGQAGSQPATLQRAKGVARWLSRGRR